MRKDIIRSMQMPKKKAPIMKLEPAEADALEMEEEGPEMPEDMEMPMEEGEMEAAGAELEAMKDEELKAELERRGFSVSKAAKAPKGKKAPAESEDELDEEGLF